MTTLTPTLTAEALGLLATRPLAPWLLLGADGAAVLNSAEVNCALTSLKPSERADLDGAFGQVLRLGAPKSRVVVSPLCFVVEPLRSGGALAFMERQSPPNMLTPTAPDDALTPQALDTTSLRDMIEAMVGDFTMIEVIPGRSITAVGRWAVVVPASALPEVVDAICALLHPDDAPRAHATLTAAWTTPQDFDLSVRAASSIGEGYRWRFIRGRALTDPQGQIQRLLCIDVDVTDAHDSSHDLALARELIEESATALWATHADGRILLVNEATKALGGTQGEVHVGRRPWELSPVLNEANWRDTMAQLRAHGRHTLAYRVPVPAGGATDLSSTARLVHIDGEEIVVGSITNKTSERLLEAHQDAEAFLSDLAARLMRCSDDALHEAMAVGLEGLGRRAGAFICRVMDLVTPHDGEAALHERLRWEAPPPARAVKFNVCPAPAEVGHLATGELLAFRAPGDPMPPGLEELQGCGMVSAALSAGGKLVGTLCLAFEAEGFATRHELSETLILRVAELFARALDRVRQNQDALAQRRQLNTVLRNLPGLAYRARLEGDCPIVLITEGARALLGVPAASLVGTPLRRLIAPEDQPRVREARHSLTIGGQSSLEYRLAPSAERPLVWVLEHYTLTQDPNDGALYIDGMITDITARHIAEDVRDLFFSQLDVPMLMSNFETDLLAWNSAFCRLTGYTDAELRGQRFSTLLSTPEHERVMLAEVSAQVQKGDPRYRDVVSRLRRKDGREVLISWTGYVELRHPMRSFNMARDLTAILEAEESNRRREAQLQQAQRLESLGVMAGGLAHDFNNLIAVVLAGLDLVSRQVTDRPSALRQLTRMRSAMERSAQLVAQLLAFGRRQVTQRESLDVNQLIEDRLALLRGAIPADIAVELSLGAARPAFADPSQLEQALMNLVVNALDAMPAGGRLEIATSNRDLPPAEAAAHRVEPGLYVSLTVRDSGPGMSEEVRERIFDPFFTTKPVGQGTGLGLASTYGILTAHGGAVRVETALGKGTTFELLVPVSAAAPRSLEPQAEPEPPHRGSARLLIVEDNEDLRELVGDVLALAGYEVHRAQDSAEALKLLAAHSFHLLITDVVMPGVNGVELVQAAMKVNPALKTITMSGYAWSELVQARRLPPDAHFLRKPFQNAELLRVVGEVLAG